MLLNATLVPGRLFDAIEKAPFLGEALAGNTRFGSRLVLKYPEFDEASREKIQFLFESKKDILKDNPEMDPESLEFRELMQERLRDFERNEEIIGTINDAGINAEEFLNYSETRYFTLREGGEAVSFSEKIQSPIVRLGETLESYGHQIKDVLSPYREDMKEIETMPKSAGELEQQIKKMERDIEQARAEGNEKKSPGHEPGA
ncbi:hypothetical protein KJ969_04640 [Patescibacteria group bacterium]|nr:hypothetical protein [Patescibacteria group bacterium]MBU1922302.1 hypothetical protein [Patescibacteria group bacterium]